MTWGVGEGGGEVLPHASEYLGDCTVDELSDYACRMAEGDAAFLYTRWHLCQMTWAGEKMAGSLML